MKVDGDEGRSYIDEGLREATRDGNKDREQQREITLPKEDDPVPRDDDLASCINLI